MLKDTFKWVRNEWGIFAKRDEMSAAEVARWLRQWVPFGVRTIGYGSLSLMFGPLTADRRASTWAMKRWSRASLESLAIDCRLQGRHLVPGGGVMYVANHQSLLDILVLGAALPGDLKWVAKRSLLRVPFLGWHLALSGHVPVDRAGGRRAAAEAIKRFEQVLREDKALLIFPEGTRSEDGELKPFKLGGFYAAVRAGVPVVPVALDGTFELMTPGASDTGKIRRRRRVDVQIGEPLRAMTDGKERERVDDLCRRTEQAVRTIHAQIRQANQA